MFNGKALLKVATPPATVTGLPPPVASAAGHGRPRRLAWAELLQRVFGIDALRCPRCGARMRLLAAIEDPVVARKILECLDLPARAPPLDTATNPPTRGETDSRDAAHAWDFDQTPPDEDGPPYARLSPRSGPGSPPERTVSIPKPVPRGYPVPAVAVPPNPHRPTGNAPSRPVEIAPQRDIPHASALLNRTHTIGRRGNGAWSSSAYAVPSATSCR